MRKAIVIIGMIVLMIIPAGLFAQTATGNDTVVWDSIYDTGNLMATVGVGWVFSGLGVSGGAEYFVYQLKIADVIPLDFSVVGRAGLNLNGWTGGLAMGFGGLAGAHFSFGGLENAPAFLDNLDFYVGLGIGFSIIPGWTGVVGPGLGFASISGVNYFLTRNIAVNAEYANMGVHFGTGTIGISFRI